MRKFIQLKKEIFPKVKDNVAAAQERQKVHYMTQDINRDHMKLVILFW